MSRSLSSLMHTMVRAQQTKEVFVALITIAHPSLISGPIRLVQDLQNLTSNGNLYTMFPFRLILPEDSDQGVPQVMLNIDNVSQEIYATIKALPPQSPPTISIDLVVQSQPDIVEFSLPNLTLREVSADLLVIEGTLRGDEEDLNEFPQDAFTPQNTPGLFA